jgi:hypothetical protein
MADALAALVYKVRVRGEIKAAIVACVFYLVWAMHHSSESSE